MKIALVGATGMVGEIMLNVLEERDFPISNLLLVASERSVGKKLSFRIWSIQHKNQCDCAWPFQN